MNTIEIAQKLNNRLFPANPTSGWFDATKNYILVRDTNAAAYLVAARDAARFLDSASADYDDFCCYCDTVQDAAAALEAWNEYEVGVTDGCSPILDAELRAALEAGETVYEVESADGQAHIGYYAGDDDDDAIRAMLDDAGSDDDPSLYRAIRVAG